MTGRHVAHAPVLLAAVLLVAVLALWCGAGAAHAQASSSVLLGAKAGAGMSSFAGGATGGAASRPASGVGGFMTIRFDPSWAFQIDVLYTAKGADQPGSVQIDNQTYDGPLTWKYRYTDIQASVARSLPLGTGSLRLFAGPVLAVLVTAEMEHAQGTLDVEQLTTASQMELALGAGYEHPVGRVRLGLEARYALGLNTLDDVPLRDTYERKQQSWLLLLGVAFDLER
jgi:hypothetical protein